MIVTCQDHTRSERTLRLLSPSLQPPLGDMGLLALKPGLLYVKHHETWKVDPPSGCLDNLLATCAPLAHRDTGKGCLTAQLLRVNHPGIGHAFFFSDLMCSTLN